MGVVRGGRGGGLIHIWHINVYTTQAVVLRKHQLSPNIVVPYWAGWRRLRPIGNRSKKFLLKNVLAFSEKIGSFLQKWVFFQQNDLYFLRGSLDGEPTWVEALGACPVRFLFDTATEGRESWWFYCFPPSPPENYSADTLDHTYVFDWSYKQF